MTSAAENLQQALAKAKSLYHDAVLKLAHDCDPSLTGDDEPIANVDKVHQARTRVLALEAAIEHLTTFGVTTVGK